MEETEEIDRTHRVIRRKHQIFYMTGYYPQRKVLGFFWRNMSKTPFQTMRQAEEVYTGKRHLKIRKI